MAGSRAAYLENYTTAGSQTAYLGYYTTAGTRIVFSPITRQLANGIFSYYAAAAYNDFAQLRFSGW